MGTTVTSGGQAHVERLYQGWKRLPNPERNLSIAHAPRDGKDVLRWDRNSRGRCKRAESCEWQHDHMWGNNIHWEIEAEFIRLGGQENRPALVEPGNVDRVANQLRDNNQRQHGEQPSVPLKARRREATGSWGNSHPMTER